MAIGKLTTKMLKIAIKKHGCRKEDKGKTIIVYSPNGGMETIHANHSDSRSDEKAYHPLRRFVNREFGTNY
jgi:hypothetical protein